MINNIHFAFVIHFRYIGFAIVTTILLSFSRFVYVIAIIDKLGGREKSHSKKEMIQKEPQTIESNGLEALFAV
jgi:hypothetical protein